MIYKSFHFRYNTKEIGDLSMDNYENNAFFWQKIDTLVFSSKFVLSRKKGEQHPEYKNLIL